MPPPPQFLPSQHGLGSLGGSGGGGAPGTPTRQGQPMAPSVVISPSTGNAPVSSSILAVLGVNALRYPTV